MSSFELYDQNSNLLLTDKSQPVLTATDTQTIKADPGSIIPLNFTKGSLYAITAYGLPKNNPNDRGENITYQLQANGIKIDTAKDMSPNVMIKELSLKSLSNDMFLSTYKEDGSRNWSIDDFRAAPLLLKKLVATDNISDANYVGPTLKPDNRVWFLTNAPGGYGFTSDWTNYKIVQYQITNPYKGSSMAAGFALFTNQARPIGNMVSYLVEF